MTDQNESGTGADRLVDIAREIEKRIDRESPSESGSTDSSQEIAAELDDQQRVELARIEGALAFLNRVRGDIEPINAADESVKAQNDLTRADRNEPDSNRAASEQAGFREIPKQIGRFEIIKVLGQGGFARVFLARDPKLERQIALKVPKPTVLVSPESRIRFEREAKAAAVLDHPNIVPLFESGSIGPITYIASGYCSGPSLGEWFEMQGRKVDPGLAAELVQQLAEAVQHAHQRGVIHRDLKPSNVLFDADMGEGFEIDRLTAVLRISDFGLAKVEQSEDHTLTADGAIVGTPAYMSPEQARGEKLIDSAADVYSLGVILYELLTGKLPHLGDNHVGTLRSVESDEPRAPRRHRNTIPRDLEAICLKAMSKSKSERYPTAYDFAEDLQRWRENRPVRARNLGPFRRSVRWTKRNPAIAAALGFAVCCLIGGLVSTTWQWRRSLDSLDQAEFQRNRAERHLERVESSVDDVIQDISVSLKDLPELSPLREKVLMRILEIQSELIEEEKDNPLVQTKTVQAYLRMAEIQRMLGKRTDSRKNIQQAISLIRNADPSTEYYDDLQLALTELLIEQAQILFDQNRYRAALPVLADAVEQVEMMIREEFSNEIGQLRVDTYRMQGIAFEKNQKFDQAEQAYLKALSVGYDPQKEHSERMDHKFATTLNSLAILFKRTGDVDRAMENYLQSAMILNRLRKNEPHRPDYHYECAIVEYNLGNLYFVAKNYADAENHYETACQAFADLRKSNPDNYYYTMNYMRTLGIYAATLARLNKFDEAQEKFKETIAIGQKFPDQIGIQSNLIRAYNNLGRMQHQDLNQPERAKETFAKVVTACRHAILRFPNDLDLQKSLSFAYGNLTDLEIDRRQWKLAEQYANKQFEVIHPAFLQNRLSPDFRSRVVGALEDLAKVHVLSGNFERGYEAADRIAQLDDASIDMLYRSSRAYAKIHDLLLVMREAANEDLENAEAVESLTEKIEIARARALQQLQKAIEAGFKRRETVESKDPVWESLRGRDEFRQIVESMK